MKSSTIIPTEPAAPILPGTDGKRGQHTRRREKFLTGRWEDELQEELKRRIGTTRASGMSSADMSSNVLQSVCTQLAVLYDGTVTINDDGLAGVVQRAGLWQLMAYVQRMCIGLNEGIVAIRATSGDLPQFRYVSPGYVVARSRPDEPDVPVALKELRLKEHPETGELMWVWECWDASPGRPSFHIEAAGGDGGDITRLFAEVDGAPVDALVGDAYPYRYSDGTPLLPYTVYHHQRSPFLFNAYHNAELVAASLAAAVGWSLYFHALQAASWPQRYMIGCSPAGVGAGDSQRAQIVTDPATVLHLKADEDSPGGQPVVGQWAAGSDPSMIADSLTKYEARLAASFGISPSDVQRMGGSAARSGYAISISHSGKRSFQQKLRPNFERGDLDLLSKTAAILNRATGSNYPEDGLTISYQPVPRTEQELEAIRRHVLELLAAGLIDRVEAIMQLHPALSRTEAEQRARDIQALNITTAPR